MQAISIPPQSRAEDVASNADDRHPNRDDCSSYYNDESFAMPQGSKEINMWNVYNLLTGANKSSYIDNFLDRSLNATQLAEGLNKALYGDKEYSWFIE